MSEPADTTEPPTWQLQLPDRASIIVGELAKRGHWTVATLATGIPWPVKTHKIVYLGQDFWIIPPTQDTSPAVAMRVECDATSEHRTQMMRFLSALSWTQGSGVRVSGLGGGSMPFLTSGRGTGGYVLTADFVVRDLPEPDAQGQLALALMREARGLDHPAYSFLTFYRVLEAALPKGRARGAWITDALEKLKGQAKEAIGKVRARGIDDVGAHIQRARRQAIAHAAEQPIMDPDDYSVVRELYEELPLIQGLAERAIEEIFGIPTGSSIYRAHLYELAGFRDIMPPDFMKKVMEGPWEDISGTIDLPLLDIELRRSEPFAALRGMVPIALEIAEAALKLLYRSSDNLIDFEFELHFDSERLVFDLERGLQVRDDGSTRAACNIADLRRFQLSYIGNGELHLYDADTRALVSRVDAFMPVNYWANHEWFESEIVKWLEIAAQRANLNPPI
ncbi:MAG TPA: methylamine utilization protein MauJ [Sphingomonas sp.]|nr:methylamine utilization protein MauJ [Sphingomonas sp.]